jgi:receptor protein-tyrosine kinase
MREQLLGDRPHQLRAIEAELVAMRRSLQAAADNQHRAKLEMRVAVIQEQEKEMAAELARQQAAVQRWAERLRRPDQPNTELEALREEVAQAEQTVRKVAEQRDILQVEPPVPLRCRLLEAAEIPDSMDVRQQGKAAGLGGLSLFSLAVLGTCLQDYRRRRLSTEEDVLRGAGQPVIGTLPSFPSPTGAQESGCAEVLLHVSADALRQKLLRAHGGESRVVVVSSARMDEGRILLANQLAQSLARGGYRTLLLHGELLAPAAHLKIDDVSRAGFSEVVLGELSLAEAVRTTNTKGLSTLAAGNRQREALQALSGPNGVVFFQTVREHFDFILIAACPILASPSALLFAKYSAGAILAVRRGVSDASSVRAACEQLSKIEARIFGVVLTDSSPSGSDPIG